jgi:DNA-binding NtrC family response regulator
VSLQYEIEVLKEQIGKQYDLDMLLIGTCEPMLKIRSLIDKAAKTQITVSISGETGTGKELVAKAIHFNSDRARKSFVAVNVASIPRDLLESELFGHEKGAFTGAVARRKGKFEEAHQGTLFLDEIAELDLNLQAKLLRVLQEREVTRVGSNEVIAVDARIIVATNKNLAEETGKGNFREDLYYRLLGLPITIPPLRDRGSDILILAKHFFDEFAKANKLSRKICAADAKEKLLNYQYPGNVRELKAMVELSAVMSERDMIYADDITFTSAKALPEGWDDNLTMEEFSARFVQRALEKNNHNVVETAKKLGIGKSTIYRMLQQKKI